MAIVYQHIRLDNNNIFYIGIGTKLKRAYEKSDKRNIVWSRIVNKTDYKIEILAENISWEDACKMEISLIKKYGRLDLGLGTLANLTDGGDGSINRIQPKEEKEKRANSIRGMKRNDETKLKISLANKGKIRTAEAKEKMSLAHIGQISINAKMVLDQFTGIFFDSLRSGCMMTNVKYKNEFALMSRNSNKSRFKFI
jgi:hypothetical protein